MGQHYHFRYSKIYSISMSENEQADDELKRDETREETHER